MDKDGILNLSRSIMSGGYLFCMKLFGSKRDTVGESAVSIQVASIVVLPKGKRTNDPNLDFLAAELA